MHYVGPIIQKIWTEEPGTSERGRRVGVARVRCRGRSGDDAPAEHDPHRTPEHREVGGRVGRVHHEVGGVALVECRGGPASREPASSRQRARHGRGSRSGGAPRPRPRCCRGG